MAHCSWFRRPARRLSRGPRLGMLCSQSNTASERRLSGVSQEGKGKEGKGKSDPALKGLTLTWKTPDGRDICFAYNSKDVRAGVDVSAVAG